MASNSWIPFHPNGITLAIKSSNSANDGELAPIFSTIAQYQEVGQYRIVNPNTFIVHLGVGNSPSEAQANALPAQSGAPAPGIPCLPLSTQILRFNIGSYFAGTSDDSGLVFITPGQGL